MKTKKKVKKAKVKISIKGIDDIIIERRLKEYSDNVEGNEEIHLLQKNV